MKATIDEDGTLVVTATDWVEAYALEAWSRENFVQCSGHPLIPDAEYIKGGRILICRPTKEQA